LAGPVPPVAAALATRPEELLTRARRIASAVGGTAVESEGRVGGGGAPGVPLPSAAVALSPELAKALRLGEPSVVGHVHDGRLLLDLLTVPEEHDELLVSAVRRASGAVD
jgi:L-seryl-tRNA(Ser) seleniumtransferase